MTLVSEPSPRAAERVTQHREIPKEDPESLMFPVGSLAGSGMLSSARISESLWGQQQPSSLRAREENCLFILGF